MNFLSYSNVCSTKIWKTIAHISPNLKEIWIIIIHYYVYFLLANIHKRHFSVKSQYLRISFTVYETKYQIFDVVISDVSMLLCRCINLSMWLKFKNLIELIYWKGRPQFCFCCLNIHEQNELRFLWKITCSTTLLRNYLKGDKKLF